jgi:hypothetical protein
VDLPVADTPPVGRRYFWRLRACCPGNCCTDWSRARYVEVGRLPNDLNGDGWSDLVVGAPGGRPGSPQPGLVWILFGGPTLDAEPDLQLTGASAGDAFGSAVAFVRDMNADGLADLAVAAPYGAPRPYVELFLGAAAPGSTPATTYDDPSAGGSRFGSALAAAGDIDADGFADLIIGAPWDSETRGDGTAFIARGGSPPAADPVRIVGCTSGDAPCLLGSAVAGVGDLDGDGFADVALGAPHSRSSFEHGEFDGYVDVCFGDVAIAAGRCGGGYQLGAEYPAHWPWFGAAVCRAGDIDGNGYGDILVGAAPPAAPVVDRTAGAAYVYHGFGWWGARPGRSLSGEAEGDLFGARTAHVGDMNGDTLGDLAIAAPGEGGTGRVHLLLSASPPGTFDELVLGPAGATVSFGASVAGAGDLDGDGFDDLVVGAPRHDDPPGNFGAVYLFRGGDPPAATSALELRGHEADSFLGAAVD